jgi:hypothetical protein
MSKCCKTCRHLAVQPNAAGKRVVRRDGAYLCTAPLPEMPNLPASVTEAYGWTDLSMRHRSYMTGDRGTNCPTWEPLS